MDWFHQNASALIAVGSALLSTLVTGGYAWLNNRQNNQRFKLQIEHEKSKENKKLFLDKGEELYNCLREWIDSRDAYFLAEEKHMRGDINLKEKTLLLEEYLDPNIYSRLEILIPIYFSELMGSFQQCLEAANSAHTVYDDFIKVGGDQAAAASLYEKHKESFEEYSKIIRVQLQKILLMQVKN